MTFSQRLENEQKRIYTLFTIVNGRGFYLENGIPYTRKEFEEKYPAPLVVNSDPQFEDIDSTRKWMR